MPTWTQVLSVFCCYAECVDSVLRMAPLGVTKGLPQIQAPYPDTTVSRKRKDPLLLSGKPLPEASRWAPPHMPMPQLITGRGGAVTKLTRVSQGSPLGLGLLLRSTGPKQEGRPLNTTRLLLGTRGWGWVGNE